MNKKKFIDHYNNINTKRKQDEQINLEFYEWENKIDFYKEYVEVFWDYNINIIIDENIWFIHNECSGYYIKEFLETCIKHKFTKWYADLFYENLIYSQDEEKDVQIIKEIIRQDKITESFNFNDNNKWALAMLKLISEKEGWEDKEYYYRDLFFANIK